ncbi:helix-turn-helix domain-containing protein [Oceanobacter mangrovi]|uniref:helix-turn-helix domain-containing protein n=1 Tax=Oceanobacter mangrovi TaxID=2862510 RepID=UPI001C8D4E70|nr:helix-turn-helix domain-containing protein [Oceanobacter mangrovi]
MLAGMQSSPVTPARRQESRSNPALVVLQASLAQPFQLLQADSKSSPAGFLEHWQFGDVLACKTYFQRDCQLQLQCPAGCRLLAWEIANQAAPPCWITPKTPQQESASAHSEWIFVVLPEQRIQTSLPERLEHSLLLEGSLNGTIKPLYYLLLSITADSGNGFTCYNDSAYAELFYRNLFLAMNGEHRGSQQPAQSEHPRVRQVRNLIEARITDDIEISELADACQVSVKTLYNLFNRELNMTPSVFMRNLKLMASRKDLQQSPELNITTIATRYGFTNLSRFASHYRQQFGETPSDTLRQSRQ